MHKQFCQVEPKDLKGVRGRMNEQKGGKLHMFPVLKVHSSLFSFPSPFLLEAPLGKVGNGGVGGLLLLGLALDPIN